MGFRATPTGKGLIVFAIACGSTALIRGSSAMLGLAVGIFVLASIGMLSSSAFLNKLTVSGEFPEVVDFGQQFVGQFSISGGAESDLAISVFDSPPCPAVAAAGQPITATASVPLGRYDKLPASIVAVQAPGLFGAAMPMEVQVEQPTYVVAPAVQFPVPNLDRTSDSFVDPIGEMAGLREYVPGDRVKDVHWPSFARTSTMLVRDNRAEHIAVPVVIAVAPTPTKDLFRVAGMARHAVTVLRGRGHPVTLGIGDTLTTISSEHQAAKLLSELRADQPQSVSTSQPTLTVAADKGATWATS